MARIMIVDDAAFMRMNLKTIVEKNNHSVVEEAVNGRNAVKKYKDISPDLVTMDITMPEMNGIEATKRIISMDQSAKIVMCSAMGQQKMVVEAIEAGAEDFIFKPFQEDSVLQTITKALS